MKVICPLSGKCELKSLLINKVHCSVHEQFRDCIGQCVVTAKIIEGSTCVPHNLRFYMKEVLKKDNEE